MKVSVFTILILALLSNNTLAETKQREDVLIPIQNLFDGMRERDGDKVRSAFAPNAVMHRAHQTLRTNMTPEDFANAVENNIDQIWDEKIWDIDVAIDDNLASVWTKFAFLLDGKISHCGVNSFQLYRFEDGWRIIYLVDTNRRENCALPEDYQ